MHSSTLGPSFFHLQRATLHPLLPLSCLRLLALMAFLSPSYKDPHGYIKPAPVVQDNLLIAVSLVVQMVKDLPAIQETQVQSLGWEDPQEKGMTTLSIPWREEPGGLQSTGSKKVGHD